jgi:hypothetical protein
MEIDDEIATFLRPGPFSVVIATRDADRTPDVVRGWAPQINADCGAIDVFVGREPARRLIDNVNDNGAMALAVCNVNTFQALQLKGTCTEIGEPSTEDSERVRDHIDQFAVSVAQIGFSEQAMRAVGVSDVIRLRFVPDFLFDQTPGPEAGKAR